MIEREDRGPASAFWPVDEIVDELHFPVRKLVPEPAHGRIRFILGHPETMQRNLQPLERGQLVTFVSDGFQVQTLLWEVGEGWVTVTNGILLMPGVDPSYSPRRMIRPRQKPWEFKL